MKLLTALRLHKPGVNNVELMEYLQSVHLNPVQFHNDIQELLDLHKKEVEEVVSKEFKAKHDELLNTPTLHETSNKRGELCYAAATLVYFKCDNIYPAIRNVDLINREPEEAPKQ